MLELGTGSGHLTRHLLAAGHRVIAADASPAMPDLLTSELADVHPAHGDVPAQKGTLWHRDDEEHANVLVDSADLPPLLAAHGVTARLGNAFGQESLPWVS